MSRAGNRLMVLQFLDVHHTKPCRSNEYTAHNGDFGDQGIGDKSRRELGYPVNSTLPDEDKQAGDADPKAITGGNDDHGHQIERGGPSSSRCYRP